MVKSKTKKLHNGKAITLWLNEETNQWVLDKNIALCAVSNFSKYIDNYVEDVIIEGIDITLNKVSSIRQFYVTAPEYTQFKIKTMINEDIKKIDIVHSYILEKIIELKRSNK